MTILPHFFPEVEHNFVRHLFLVPLYQFLPLLGRFGIGIVPFQSRNQTTIVLELRLIEEMWEVTLQTFSMLKVASNTESGLET